MNHGELVTAAGRWLRGTAGCTVVLEELSAVTGNGETPDAIGWYTARTLLIECKASRSDFLADRKKRFRARPESGMGLYRYFMAPKGLIRIDELPDRWGLLEVERNRVHVAAGYKPRTWGLDSERWEFIERFQLGETQMLLSAMQRIKVRVGTQEFHSMLHQRLMKESPPPVQADFSGWAKNGEAAA